MTNADAMTALGDRTRRAIFERLAEGPSAVGALARDLPVSRPAVSQHLKVLKLAGLVTNRQEGNRRIYSVDQAGVDALRAYFEQFSWKRALDSYKTTVQQRDEEVS